MPKLFRVAEDHGGAARGIASEERDIPAKVITENLYMKRSMSYESKEVSETHTLSTLKSAKKLLTSSS